MACHRLGVRSAWWLRRLRAALAARRRAEMRKGALRVIAASAAVRRIPELTGSLPVAPTDG